VGADGTIKMGIDDASSGDDDDNVVGDGDRDTNDTGTTLFLAKSLDGCVMNSMSMVLDVDTTSSICLFMWWPALKANRSSVGLTPFLTFTHCLFRTVQCT
jgi:hypothetical protein